MNVAMIIYLIIGYIAMGVATFLVISYLNIKEYFEYSSFFWMADESDAPCCIIISLFLWPIFIICLFLGYLSRHMYLMLEQAEEKRERQNRKGGHRN